MFKRLKCKFSKFLSHCNSPLEQDLSSCKSFDSFYKKIKEQKYISNSLGKGRTKTFSFLQKQIAQITKVYRPQGGIINKIAFNLYNQIFGLNSVGSFKNDTLDWIKSYGNGESIYFAQNDKGALVGLNKAICDTINIAFNNNKVSEVLFSGQPDAGFFPFYPESINTYFLKDFSYSIYNSSSINNKILGYLINSNSKVF